MNGKRIAVLLLTLLLLTGCGGQEKAFTTLDDFDTAKIGVLTGSSHDPLTGERFPNAERMYYTTNADMILAAGQGKLDGYVTDLPYFVAALWEGAEIRMIEEPLQELETAFAFPKGDRIELREEMSAFVEKATVDGTLAALERKWLGSSEPTEHPDYTELTGENGTIRVAATADLKPLAYRRGELLSGYEMELLTMFAREYGYRLDVQATPFEAILPGISTGKYDLGVAGFNITAERQESVDFSSPHLTVDVVIACPGDGAAPPERTLAYYREGSPKIGVITGSSHDQTIAELLPNAQRVYFNQMADATLSVEQGKIDGYAEDGHFIAAMVWEGADVQVMQEPLRELEVAFAFPKGGSLKLQEQINAYIGKLKADGTLQQLKEKWTGDTEPQDFLDYRNLPAENGTIRLAVVLDTKPLLYQKNDYCTGMEMEILTRFAMEHGYALDLEEVLFDSVLAGLATGKYDMAAAGLNVTEERRERVDFSDAYLIATAVMVYSDAAAEKESFPVRVAEGFEKTFVREQRWKLILEGMLVTMVISVCSALGGTGVGFGLYMLSRSEKRPLRRAARGTARVYSRIVAGTPVVVILMILFYVVFGKFRNISGVLVAIIGFTLTFGAFFYDNMAVAVDSVDPGQTEAAYALGYTRNRTFFRIVLPQAMSIFLPAYCGEAVALVKATAVVGYIAVNDLTKMGDIIRSNTYEAFFPLIATAVIYFLLTWIVAGVLGVLKRKFEPKRRSAAEILKGVQTT